MKKIFSLGIFGIFSFSLFSQNAWIAGNESQKRFIENKGQFDNMNPGFATLYSADWGKTKILFSKNGLTYRLDNPKRNPEHKEGSGKPKYLANYDLVHMIWENSNPDVQIIAEEKTDDYFSYTKTNGENINYIKGYTKLIYKNLYPNIDVEYIFPPSPEGEGRGEAGIKYSLTLHPGADASQIKMKYSGSSLRAERSNLTLDVEGNIHIPTKFGDIIDHAPLTFFADNKKEIASSFSLANDVVTFSLPNGEGRGGATVVIDPWTVTPTIGNSNGVWECEVDGAGNVYIIGGDSPMKLLKYNSAGTIQWTYSTPWDTANSWLGTLKTDLAGNNYITNGSVAAIQKVNTNAGLIWTKNTPAQGIYEYWSITFNCDQTRLVVGGTTGIASPPYNLDGAIYNIDINNGNIIDSIIVGAMSNTNPQYINEVRTITSSPNNKFYYLTLDTVGAISNFCSSPIFAKSHSYSFAYKCENFRPKNGNGGISSIKANKNFVYTQNGTTIHKRSPNTGTIITTAAIPGGISTLSFGRYIVGNSGIDIDSCGNVYVGSANQIIKYDANLNILGATPTTYAVSDVAVSSGGNVIVCGTTGTNTVTVRTGYVQSINMAACNPINVFPCCDASVCAAGYYCINSTADTLIPATTGGIWSGTGITNTAIGVFDPAVAGVGNHTIIYTLPCGNDSITITVNSCLLLNACQNTNGSITILNGTGPYTWYKDTTYQDCSACLFPASCAPPAANCPQTINTWMSFATGTTVMPGSNYPILVVSSTADSVQINSLVSLPNCVVSVQENNLANGWNLILQNPPIGNELSGNLFAPENADVLVTIIDMQGKTVKKNSLKVSKGVNSFRMDVPAESGTYFIVISDSTSGRQLVKKFVKL